MDDSEQAGLLEKLSTIQQNQVSYYKEYFLLINMLRKYNSESSFLW